MLVAEGSHHRPLGDDDRQREKKSRSRADEPPLPPQNGHPHRRNRLSGAIDDASRVRYVRIEDHSLLADLYLAVPEAAGALVDVQEGAGCALLSVDESKTTRDCTLTE
jgi:hypothetical protein